MFVRRGGRGAASACFDTGAADGAAAIGGACAVVAGADDGFAGAGTGVDAGFGGSDLATAFSPMPGGAAFTGVAGFGGVVDFDGVVVTASAFGGGLAFGIAAGGGEGCDATVCVVVCGVTAFGGAG